MIKDVMRLAQADPQDEPARQTIEAMLETIKKMDGFRIEYRIEPLQMTPSGLQAGSLTLPGHMASRMLKTCERVVVLIATLGYEFERELTALQHRTMRDALLWDACGSVWLEHELDTFEAGLASRQKAEGWFLTDRFSCGYGDLPLDLQTELVAGFRDIGVRVLPSGMMYPTKNVSALIGLSRQPQPARIKGCAACSMRSSCPDRKEGKHCD